MIVKGKIISQLIYCKRSKEIWDVLNGLYETKKTNYTFFFMTKILSIKMEANENITNFISYAKDLSDKLGDVGEKVSSTDLVTITLYGLVQGYHLFSRLLTREKSPYI